MSKALAGFALTAAINATIAAGGVQLPSAHMLSVAIEHCRAPSHLAHTLKSIATYHNEQTKCSFPGYELLAKGAKVARRTVIERVHGIQDLDLEKHGICVIVEFRNFRGAERRHWPFAGVDRRPGDVARSQNYRMFVAPWLAKIVGFQRHEDWQPDDTNEADEAAGADGFAAPEPPPPLPSVMPPAPRPSNSAKAPTGLGTCAVGAVAGECASSSPPPPNPYVEADKGYPETEEVRQIREVMLQYPETREFAPQAGKFWHLAQHPEPDKAGKPRVPRTLAMTLAAVRQWAAKALPTMSKAYRWQMGVAFLLSVRAVVDGPPPQARLTPEQRRLLDEQEELARRERQRLNAALARSMGMTPGEGRRTAAAAERAKEAALAQKKKDDRVRLAALEAEQAVKKPP